ncbi:MAG: ABC transporter ATP-binding protein [Azospirillum brasilense]|nr:MAG: ABC transporter ATP-binding protein [Azospirillum brasilense]
MSTPRDDIILRVQHIENRFGEQRVHDDVTLDIKRGEIIGIVGGSGAGKSVLLKTMLGLHTPNAGEILVQGKPLASLTPRDRASLFGVLFQQGALFSSLNVERNITLPMREYTDLPDDVQQQLALMKLALVEMKPEVAQKMPAELSGGMIKRAALARALALDPAILFLDEPTAGLDPLTADAFDTLIRTLNETLGVTVVMVTHDLDSLVGICHRVAVLVDRKVIVDSLPNLMENKHPWIQEYFHGPRARAAMAASTARQKE